MGIVYRNSTIAEDHINIAFFLIIFVASREFDQLKIEDHDRSHQVCHQIEVFENKMLQLLLISLIRMLTCHYLLIFFR